MTSKTSPINEQGGLDAVNLRIAEQYLNEFGKLAQKNNTLIIPSNLSDIAGTVGAVAKIFSTMSQGSAGEPAKPGQEGKPPLKDRQPSTPVK
jgi:hypothetical protein